MSLSTVRTQIKTMLLTVSGIGTVYDYKRFVNNWETYKNLFVKDSKINTWEIQRLVSESQPYGGSGGREDRTHDFIIRGFYAINDNLASEKTFQDLVDSIIDVFRSDPTLSGVTNIVNFPIRAAFTEGKLGDVLSHVVEIQLSVSERILF